MLTGGRCRARFPSVPKQRKTFRGQVDQNAKTNQEFVKIVIILVAMQYCTYLVSVFVSFHTMKESKTQFICFMFQIS